MQRKGSNSSRIFSSPVCGERGAENALFEPDELGGSFTLILGLLVKNTSNQSVSGVSDTCAQWVGSASIVLLRETTRGRLAAVKNEES